MKIKKRELTRLVERYLLMEEEEGEETQEQPQGTIDGKDPAVWLEDVLSSGWPFNGYFTRCSTNKRNLGSHQ